MTKNDVSYVLEIVSGAHTGKQFHLALPGGGVPTFPSVSEKTLQRYSGRDDSTNGSETMADTYIQQNCLGYGNPHPWSKKVKGVFVVCCPNADKTRIWEHAAANIKAFKV